MCFHRPIDFIRDLKIFYRVSRRGLKIFYRVSKKDFSYYPRAAFFSAAQNVKIKLFYDVYVDLAL